MSYGDVQCHMRGYTDTQGSAPWSLTGTRGSWMVSSAMYEGIYRVGQKHMIKSK